MKTKVFIHTNESKASKVVKEQLISMLEKSNFIVTSSFDKSIDLLVCVGGDGTFLQAAHKYGFPDVPFIGINTGHLGFFQEIMPNQLDEFIYYYNTNKYRIQKITTVQAEIKTKDETHNLIGINEIQIKGPSTSSTHLNISISGSFIERFSGDGILVSTPSGSTAYNYSLGGSIVDPRVNLLQVTPIAPINTTAYRCFTSSIVMPAELTLEVELDDYTNGKTLTVIYDGMPIVYDNVESVNFTMSKETINLLRFESYDFWAKVKSKFI
ncbi:MAG: NAD(+)/NADH kinase [Peptostreptococcaceae bacterium]|nr:NAD(+)/NADH kinase [Peptostreptococcaceae bacterium]